MKAIILQKPYMLEEVTIDFDPTLKPYEVLLKIHQVGICGTDFHAYRGNQPFFTYPRRLGHELGAEIVAIGSALNASDYPLSSRVSVEPYLHCGECPTCRKGKINCCEKLEVLGVHTEGGMAEYLIVPADKVHISNHLTYAQLALVETLAIGCHAVNRAAIQAEDIVLIIGAGPIGLSILEFARFKNKHIYILDINANRLAFCETHYSGVTTILKQEDAAEISLFSDNKPTLIFDATGNATSMNNCVSLAAHGGKIIFVGLHLHNIEIKDSLFHRKEITLMASRNALPHEFDFIIEKIEQGVIDTSKWMTHRCSFNDVTTQFMKWLDPQNQVIKAMVQMCLVAALLLSCIRTTVAQNTRYATDDLKTIGPLINLCLEMEKIGYISPVIIVQK